MKDKYLSLVVVGVKDRLYYPGRLLAHVVVLIIRVGILLALYSYAFDYLGGNVGGIDVKIASWSMAAYFIVLSLNVRRVFQALNDDVVSGHIEVMVNKPFSYLLYRVALQFGYGVPDSIIALGAMLPFLYFFVGVPATDMSLGWAVRVFMLLGGGIALACGIYTLIGLAAFWIDNASPLYWIFDKSIMVLGGSYIPVALFPHGVRALAEYSPFGASMFVTHIFNPEFSHAWLRLLLVQVTWCIVFLALTAWVYRQARQKLSVHGG